VSGTPFAVDVSGDRQDRTIWVAFLAGPVLWITHFMVVYLVAEAGCTGGGPGLDLFDPPVPKAVTAAATGVGVTATILAGAWNHRRWRANPPTTDQPGDSGDGSGRGSLAFAGLLLAGLSTVAILFQGLLGLFLPAC
jgi:4-hydroxybenzoate polyprenyltransferase